MTLQTRIRSEGAKYQHPKITMVYVSFCALLLSMTSDTCFAFLGASCGPSLLQRETGLCLSRKKLVPNSSLFGSDNDDGDKKRTPINKLDIFGQSKEDKKRDKLYEDEGDIRGPDRVKSCIPYILPMLDGDNFGKYIYERIPLLGDAHYVLLRPIVEGFTSSPVLIILLFIAFSLGPRLTNQSREVRFNAQQAILIDIALIFPSLLGDAVADAEANFPRSVMEPCSNFVWYFYITLVIYCVSSNLRGKKPDQIPFVSNLADYAIGPF